MQVRLTIGSVLAVPCDVLIVNLFEGVTSRSWATASPTPGSGAPPHPGGVDPDGLRAPHLGPCGPGHSAAVPPV